MDNTSSKSKLVISRVTFDDLPALAEVEILAFSNDKIIPILCPNRQALRESGAPIHTWPDYAETIKRRKRELVSNDSKILYKVGRSDDSNPLGMVSISFPGGQRDRTWSDRVWGDYLYPMLDYSGFGGKRQNVNEEFFSLLFSSFKVHRERLLPGRIYGTIDDLFVHPTAQGTGAGVLLLDHCFGLATTAGLPLVLESSESAFGFYKKQGFKAIGVGEVEYEGSTISWPVMIWEPL